MKPSPEPTASQSVIEPHSLDGGALGLGGVLFQGITHIAPALVIFALPFIVSKAGAAAALCFLIAVLLMIPTANTVAQFSRYVSSSGGYYTYTSEGLGRRWGFLTAWDFLLYDPPGPAAALGFLGFLTQGVLKSSLNVNVPWWIISLVALAITWIAALRGAALSARAMATLGGIELAIMVALGISFALHPAQGTSLAATFSVSSSPTGLSGVVYGVLFALLSVSGYESIAPLAEETRNAYKFVAKAVLLSLLLVGVYEVLIGLTAATAWGTGHMASFVTNANPFYALAHRLWGAGWILVFFAIVNSALALSIACFNSSSRVIYAMGRAGTLPRVFDRVHPKYRTPSTGIHVVGLVSVVLILGVGSWVGASQIFGFLGEIITIGIILVYIVGNLALVRYMATRQRQDRRLFVHIILPLVGSVLFLPVLYVTFSPFPSYPFNIAPFFVIFWMLLGGAMMYRISRRDPEAFARGDLTGASVLSPIAEETVGDRE